MALLCNVAWAQDQWFSLGEPTTTLTDGNYVLVAMSDKGTGPVIYDPDAGEGKHYRYEAGKTVAEGHAVQSKYVWTIDETTIDGVQHITVTNHDDNTKAFPVDVASNKNFTGSGKASLKTEMYTADGVDYIVLTLDNEAIGYVHANAPSGNPCLSYWPKGGDGASCIKFTFYPVNALTNEERLTYNVVDGKYNDRAGSSSDWRNGWTSTNVGKPSFTITAANGKNNMNAGSTEFIGMRPGDTKSCVYTLTLGETFTGYSFEAMSTNTAPNTNNPAHVITINGEQTTVGTEWTTFKVGAYGTNTTFTLTGSNAHDLHIRNIKFEQNAEVFAAVTANANLDIYGLQCYLGLVQNAGTGLEGDGQLICNYPAPTSKESGNAYANLLDGTYTTFFHSGYEDYRGDGSSHYLQANLGKAVKSFRFYFKKRSQNNNNRPKEILIEGSVDGDTFEEIETISDGMPSGAAPTDYYSDEITASKAYKYLRFTVKKTHSDESSSNPFFTFSEFYILPNTPKVAETFDAVRGFRAGVTVENATKLNQVFAWHQGFTGNAYPNDLYEGVYTLTINGPAAATATYNGESKALPATFYVTEEVAEENAAVTIASTESTLSFNCFSDETDTYETLTVTSLTENKVYTASFNYSLELKESTGRFTEGSKVWSLTTDATNPVALTFTSNANNMNHNGGYIQLHSGQAKSSTYTLTVPEGYIILEYSFDYAFGNTGTNDKKFVVGEQDYPVTAQSQSLSVKNVNATTTQFDLIGENQPVKVQNFIVKVKAPTAKEIADAKKTAKDGVDANAAKLQQNLGYYSYTIGGAKVYTIDEVKAAIDAAATIVEVNAITASFALNVPEVGKYYRIAYDYGNNGGVKYLQSTYHSGSKLALTDNKNASSLFYVEQVGENLRLKSYTTGKYIKEDGNTRGLHDVGGDVAFSAGSSIGKIKIKAPSYLHANGGNDACYLDHCGSDGCAQHNFIIEEVNPITLTINAPGKLNVSATWNGETKTLPATWNTFEGVTITESTLRGAGNATYAFTGFSEGDQSLGSEVIITSLDADRTLTANFAPSFFGTTLAEAVPVHIYNDDDNSYFIRLNATDGFAGKALNSGTCTYTESEMWYFVGTPENFKMYNHKAGADYAVKVAGTGGGSAATMALVAEATSLKLTLQSDGSYRIAPQAGDGNTGFNMHGGAGHDIKLYNGGGSDWLFRSISKDALKVSVAVTGEQPYENNTRVAHLGFTINGSTSSTVVKGNVEASTYYLPVGATFTLSNSYIYRGYAFDGFLDAEGNAAEYTNATIPEGGLNITAKYSVDEDNKYQYLFYYRDDEHNKPYRIPAIATASNNTVLAFSDYRPCSNDIGYGEVDIMLRRSYDNGETWSAPVCIADGQGGNQNVFNVGFGDAAVVADRESGKVLVMAVAGKQVFANGSATGHNSMAKIVSNDNGESWDAPEDVTSQFMIAENSLFPKAYTMFFGSGRMLQSRVYKAEGAAYYRIYGALLIKHPSDTYTGYCNYVVYSDDFGSTWKILGGSIEAGMCCNGGDEPKVEELPDGSIVLSSRKGGGRYFNVFTYTDKATGAGVWGDVTTGVDNNGQATNGEIYKVKAIRKEDGKICDVMLQSIPAGGGRSNVTVYYKEMDYTSPVTSATFASAWPVGMLVSNMGSAYSTMILQADGNFGFFYEELPGDNYAYCMVYVPLSLEELTNDAYSLYTVNSTIGQYGVGTFYASEAMQIPEGIKAYVATEEPVMENGAGVITMTELQGIIPAHTGAVLRGDADTYNFIPSISYGTAVENNMLVGFEGTDNKAETKKEVTLADDYTTYVLTVKNEVAGFYRKDANFKVYNNKAYLQVPDAVSANALRIRIEGEQDDYTTEIVMPVANGQQPTAIYDLTGRRVQKVQKGLYIVNGKKVWK